MSAPNNHLTGVVTHLRRWAGAGSGDQLPDSELLRRYVASRDEAAFACLVKRHGPMILSACRRILGDHHQAEDVAQATFLVLARKSRSIRRPRSLANWLFGVATRTALKARSLGQQERRDGENDHEHRSELRKCDRFTQGLFH